jgi:hypothetical protein
MGNVVSDGNNTAFGNTVHPSSIPGWFRVRGLLRAYEVVHDYAYCSRQLGSGCVPQPDG